VVERRCGVAGHLVHVQQLAPPGELPVPRPLPRLVVDPELELAVEVVSLSMGDLCSSRTRCSAFHFVASAKPSSQLQREFGKSKSLLAYSPFLKWAYTSGGSRSFTWSTFDWSTVVPGS